MAGNPGPARANACEAVALESSTGLTAYSPSLRQRKDELRKLLATATAEQLYQFVDQHCQDDFGSSCRTFTPWVLSASIRPEVRQVGFRIQLELLNTRLQAERLIPSVRPSNYSDTLQSAELFFASDSYQKVVARGYSTRANARINELLALMAKTPTDAFRWRRMLPTYCAYSGFPGCWTGLNEIAKIMQPAKISAEHFSKTGPVFAGDAIVSAPLAMKEVLSNPAYAPILTRAAAEVLAKIRHAESGGSIVGDFFGDLRTLIARSRPLDSAADQDRMFWNILGFLGSRGPSIDVLADYLLPEHFPAYGALYVLSSGVNYLDALKFKKTSRFYGLPEVVQSSCDYGKHYHSYMAGYLAHWLHTEKKMLPFQALRAVHTVAMLYEVVMNTPLRGRNFKALTAEPFSLHNLAVRYNLVFNDIGAAIGAQLRPHPNYDANQAFYQLVRATRPSSSLVSDTSNPFELTQAFRAWMKMMNPDSVLEVFRP